MAILTVYEMVPKVKLAIYGAILSVTIALATVTGPIFAGLIDNNSTWRWIFYVKSIAPCACPSQSSVQFFKKANSLPFSLPSGALAVALLVISMPSSFGSNSSSSTEDEILQAPVQRPNWVGAGLLLSVSLLLVTALVKAMVRFAWSSGATIAMLVLSAHLNGSRDEGCCWVNWTKYVGALGEGEGRRRMVLRRQCRRAASSRRRTCSRRNSVSWYW